MDEVPISKGILYQKYANVRIAAGAFGLSTTARSRYIYTLSSWEMSLRVVPVAFEITLREAQAENPAAPAGPFLLGWVFWSSHWTKQTGWFRAARAENDQTYGPYMDPYGAPETMSHPYPHRNGGAPKSPGNGQGPRISQLRSRIRLEPMVLLGLWLEVLWNQVW